MHELQEYYRYNTALADYFFNTTKYGKSIYLDLEPKDFTAVSKTLNVSEEVFKWKLPELVGKTLMFPLNKKPENPYSWQIETHRRWHKTGRRVLGTGQIIPPPFVALLSVLSMAAAKMRGDIDFKAHNYYERLFEILGCSERAFALHQAQIKKSGDQTVILWKSLNRWLLENSGECGLPTAKRLGQPWIGYPLSQTLIREAEFKNIYEAF